jgi:hypothetical protein
MIGLALRQTSCGPCRIESRNSNVSCFFFFFADSSDCSTAANVRVFLFCYALPSTFVFLVLVAVSFFFVLFAHHASPVASVSLFLLFLHSFARVAKRTTHTHTRTHSFTHNTIVVIRSLNHNFVSSFFFSLLSNTRRKGKEHNNDNNEASMSSCAQKEEKKITKTVTKSEKRTEWSFFFAFRWRPLCVWLVITSSLRLMVSSFFCSWSLLLFFLLAPFVVVIGLIIGGWGLPARGCYRMKCLRASVQWERN